MERKADSRSTECLPEGGWKEVSSLKGYLVFSALCALYFCDNLRLSWTLLTAPAIIFQVFCFLFTFPQIALKTLKKTVHCQVVPLLERISVITVTEPVFPGPGESGFPLLKRQHRSGFANMWTRWWQVAQRPSDSSNLTRRRGVHCHPLAVTNRAGELC